ncbi:secretin and TonB N-terminal domain-containing protein [Brevundimonas diminuta]|uniref:secretin and TonB N-terminal domain-containing protein n=1 Tax=Brevundimonas diminuta TaxID=293 RepID=UPI0030F85898
MRWLFAAIAAVLAALPGPSTALAQVELADGERHYDIPAQPVAAALAEFARVSGVNIIYRQSVAGARRSSAVSGALPAALALRRLLEGTGLTARFTGPTSAIIYREGAAPPEPSTASAGEGAASLRLAMAEVRAPHVIGRRDRNAINHYAMRVQREIFDRLKRDGAYEGRRFRIEIAVTVDAAGRIAEVALLRPSGETAWDARVRDVLVGERLSAPPPEGLTGSMRFEVETDRLADRTPSGNRGQRR